MALLTVLTAPDPRLHIKAKPIEVVTDEIRQLMDDMLETMYAENGMGLAATQVGIDKRIVIIDFAEDGQKPAPLKLVNPEIVWTSEQQAKFEESCLSVPYQSVEVTRFVEVRVGYLDENNQPQEIHGKGLYADCLQHEIDHLNGILSIDHLSRLKRTIVINKLLKIRKYEQRS